MTEKEESRLIKLKEIEEKIYGQRNRIYLWNR